MRVKFDDKFQSIINKIKDNSIKHSIQNKIEKIINYPEIGKPMSFIRKGTREVYVGSFRISYKYYKEEGSIEFLDFYYKDEQ